jgi:hypothetical protein
MTHLKASNAGYILNILLFAGAVLAAAGFVGVVIRIFREEDDRDPRS